MRSRFVYGSDECVLCVCGQLSVCETRRQHKLYTIYMSLNVSMCLNNLRIARGYRTQPTDNLRPNGNCEKGAQPNVWFAASVRFDSSGCCCLFVSRMPSNEIPASCYAINVSGLLMRTCSKSKSSSSSSMWSRSMAQPRNSDREPNKTTYIVFSRTRTQTHTRTHRYQ